MVGYGTIYRFEFDGTCRPFGTLLTTKCKVLIQKKGYSGGITDIPYGQVTPVEIDYPTSDDDVFYPIRGSVLSFKVLGGAINMDSIISEDETEYVVEYYRDNTLFWTGFVSPELCEEDIFLKYPAIEFRTIDALGSLEAFDLKDFDGLKSFGLKSFKDVLYGIFNSINFNYKFNTLTKVWADTMNKAVSSLEQAFVYLNCYRNADGSYFGSIDILKSLAYLFNAVVYQDSGKWWFIKIKDLAFNQNTTYQYLANGSYETTNSIPVLNHGTDFLILSEPKRKIRRFYKEVNLNYEFFSNFENLDTNFTIFNSGSTRIDKVEVVHFDEAYKEVNGVPVYDMLKFTNVRSGISPDYKFFTEVNSPIVYTYFDDRINDYGMVICGNTSSDASSKYIEYQSNTELTSGNNKFSFSVSSISNNINVQIIVDNHYYNISSNTWSTTPVINGGFDGGNNISIDNLESPYLGKIKIRFFTNLAYYASTLDSDFGYAYMATYYNFHLFIGNPDKNETITVTNIKNTSLIPQQITVYNGDSTFQVGSSNIEYVDDSNITLALGDRTMNWVERNETYAYKLQELSARNILNQYSDYRNIFTGTIIGKNLRFGAIYQFPIQGVLADKKFFPLSIKLNERDCTADVVFMELSPNEIDGTVNDTIFDSNGNIVYQGLSSSKKKIVMG